MKNSKREQPSDTQFGRSLNVAGRSQEPCEPGSGAMVGKNLLFSVYKRKNSNWATVKYRAAFVNSILGS